MDGTEDVAEGPAKPVLDDEGAVTHVIDLTVCFPHYDQFGAFGGPVPDDDHAATGGMTIKPLLDATHESLALIVSSVGSINAILQQLAAIIPSPASEGDSELARLQTTVERLSETFDLINPTKEEQ